MISFLLSTIFIFITVFFEHLFIGLFSFSILLLIMVNIIDRVDLKVFMFFTVLTSIAMDVTLHVPLGFNIIILGIALLLLTIFRMFIPFDRPVTKYILLFFIFLSAYFIRFILLFILQDGVFPVIQWSDVFRFSVNSIFSVVVCVLVDRIFASLRDADHYEKIRLK